MGIDLLGGWNQIFSIVPAGVLVLMTIAGVVLILWRVGAWVWKKQRGGGAGGFPWSSLLLGGFLAGPQLFGPALMILGQAFLGILARLLEFVGLTIG